jgi:hypothetical protein
MWPFAVIAVHASSTHVHASSTHVHASSTHVHASSTHVGLVALTPIAKAII